MKKTILFTLAVIVLLTSALTAQDRFRVAVIGSYQIPADADFKTIYGSSIAPGLAVEARIIDSLFAWGSVHFTSATGTTIGEIQESTKIKRTLIGFGLGYRLAAAPKFMVGLLAGAGSISNSEDAFGKTIKLNALGLTIGVEGDFQLGDMLLARIGATFTSASKDIVIDNEVSSKKIGGFAPFVGIGLRF
jgi:hypothetical protein